MNKLRSSSGVGVRGLWCAVVIAVGGCSTSEATPETHPRYVVTERVELGSGSDQRSFSGTVRARERALLAFEVPGKVEEVPFDVGDRFEKGDVLARLERQTRRLDVVRDRAQVAEAEAARAHAQLIFDRQAALLKRKATPQASYDDAQSQLQTAESRLEVARAQLRLAEEALGDTVLRAPYDGVIVERMVEPPHTISAGTPVLRIQGRKQLEVVIRVPETLIGGLRIGAEHKVLITALGSEPLTATVTELGADASAGGTYPVYLALNNPPASLRSGASAEVSLTLEGVGDDEVAIPLPAFLPGSGEDGTVFVVKSLGQGETRDESAVHQVQARKVQLARLTKDRAVIASGLEPEALIVTRGVSFLRDGQSVLVLQGTQARYGH